MKCTACGTDNEASRKFCRECGAPLALACHSCGSPNTPDAKFCGECGAALDPTTPPTATPALPAPAPAVSLTERRLVTVLFTDLVGFTTLSERRDAEDVRELLGRYFDTARAIVERHGGIVEKFIGDAVMAVWGTPVAHEDDAERAVRSALELVDAVVGIGAAEGIELQARAGVLSGEAAATVGAVSQGIVTGDLVNTASRLQSAAAPGTVLVGEATYRAASKAVAFEEMGAFDLKGKEESVRAWRALRVVGERGGSRLAVGLEPPFVGRVEELRAIKGFLHTTEREGKARLVSVVGIGGIGKSRLTWELSKYIDGLADDIYWHLGRCPAYGDGVAFWALGEMVRMRARIAETDDDVSSRRKLSETVDRFVTDEEERRWIELSLAHLLGLAERPSGEREELFSAWRTFFERIAERRPVVMVFEDLQWADPGVLDFIESTLEWSRSHPILILTLARPELLERRSTWGATQRNFTSMRLEPLDPTTMSDLVERFVRDLPADGITRIVDRAEGVPLYAVETVRMLADRGALEPGEDGYRFIGELGDLEIPGSLHALIAARLDALPPADRGLVQEAAILGKSFTLGALAAVSGNDPEALEPRLGDLVRKEVLTLDSDPRSPERGQYSFLQGLIREVASGTLSKVDRRRLHLAAAHHLETIDEEEQAGVVATHYVEALRATPNGPDADALAARARDWLGQAADRATSLGSSEQALAYARQALEITPPSEERTALLGKAGEAAWRAAKGGEAIELLREALDLARAGGDTIMAGKLSTNLALPLITSERVGEARDLMMAALDQLGPHGDGATIARLCQSLALTCSLMGEPGQALAYTERALPLVEELDERETFGRLIGAKGHALFNLGRHREALVLCQGAVAVADELANQTLRADTNMWLSTMLAEDDPRRALEASLVAVDAAHRAGNKPIELNSLANAAETAIDLGDFTAADRIIGQIGATPDPPSNITAAVTLNAALLAAFRGHDAEAGELLESMREPVLAGGMLQMLTWYQRTWTYVDLLAGRDERAWEAAMEAIEPDPTGMNAPLSSWGGIVAAISLGDVDRLRSVVGASKRLGGRWMRSVVATGEAGLAALEGRDDEAEAAFAAVLREWEALDLQRDHAFAAVCAIALLPADKVPADHLERARAFCEERGMVPLTERLAVGVGATSTSS